MPPDAPVSLDDSSLASLVDRLSHARVVLLGEASHGTHEYYAWRARITLELLAHHDFSFVAVEGDWPDCMAIDRFVKLDRDVPDEADEALRVFLRWPTWMWANEEVSELLGAIRALNETRRPEDRAGFYGLDVYSLWESLERVLAFADHLGPEAAQAARDAFACFEPYGREPQAYARATMMVPADCKAEAERMLVETLRARSGLQGIDARLDAEQNARVVAGAERYYRAMVRGDAQSWNVRDVHMADTLDRLLEHHGERAAKAIVWAHNTHVGDARATDMASEGMVNLGQLARERHAGDVAAVGFGSHRGTVVAAREWDAPMQEMRVPSAIPGSLEDALHEEGEGQDLLLASTAGRLGKIGHRAIGVVYHPERERGNYVPTMLSRRYDAFVFLDETHALRPIHHALERPEVPETFPWGY